MKKGFAMSDVIIYLFIIIIAVVIFALFLLQKGRVGEALTEQRILLESQVQQRTRIVLETYLRTRLDAPADRYAGAPSSVDAVDMSMADGLRHTMANEHCKDWIERLIDIYPAKGAQVFTETSGDSLCDAVVKRSILYFKSLCGENFYLLLRSQGNEETIGDSKKAGFKKLSISGTRGGFSSSYFSIPFALYEFTGSKNKAYLLGEESIPDLSVMLLCQETKGEVRA